MDSKSFGNFLSYFVPHSSILYYWTHQKWCSRLGDCPSTTPHCRHSWSSTHFHRPADLTFPREYFGHVNLARRHMYSSDYFSSSTQYLNFQFSQDFPQNYQLRLWEGVSGRYSQPWSARQPSHPASSSSHSGPWSCGRRTSFGPCHERRRSRRRSWRWRRWRRLARRRLPWSHPTLLYYDSNFRHARFGWGL